MSVSSDYVASAIYENGVTLLRLGIIDVRIAEQSDKRRYLTAILNIYAGILLILKYRLADESACDGNALIYAKKRENCENGQNKRTINFWDIRKRLSSIECGKVNENSFWDQMEALKCFRNDAEHKFVNLNKEVVDGHLLRIYDILQIAFEGAVGNTAPNALGEEWLSLSSHTTIVRDVREKRDASLNDIRWLHPRLKELVANDMCPKCGYPIIGINEVSSDGLAHHSSFKCLSCGAELAYSDMIERILEKQDFDGHVFRMKDWSMRLEHIGLCPHCLQNGFDVYTNICYCCGKEQQYACDWCGEKLTSSEVSAMVCNEESRILCSHCQHMLEKEGLVS